MLSAVLLDRDGTIIVDRHYLADPAGVELLPGAAQGLRRLQDAGVALFVVTNQSGIGRGFFDEAAYRACHQAMLDLLAREGVRIRDERHCPHAPDAACACRKPAAGMWQDMQKVHGLHAENCAMIGDKAADIRFARTAGLARAVLVLTGKGRGVAEKMGWVPNGSGASAHALPEAGERPDCVAANLDQAAAYLLGPSGVR